MRFPAFAKLPVAGQATAPQGKLNPRVVVASQVVRDMGILRVINWDHPNSEYVLSMREDDQRYCLFRLLRMSVSEGSLDARMMEQLRVDGELVPRRGL